MIPQQKYSRTDKDFTLLGLTLLTGKPLMCVVIFTDIRENKMVEMGVDPMAEEVGNIEDEDYVLFFWGKGKKIRVNYHAHTKANTYHACVHGHQKDPCPLRSSKILLLH